MKIGDKVKYRDLSGVITSIMNDMAIVKLPDGKEYSLPLDSIQMDVIKEPNLTWTAESFAPFIKSVNFWNDLAKVMQRSGLQELHVKDGEIKTFLSKESLAEKTARYKAEAMAEAERRAKEDHEKENLAII